MDTGLTAFWITSSLSHSPLGFGVTAFSLNDAINILHAFDYGRYLPESARELRVMEGITPAQLDQPHVVANMGPIAIRGLWYPFVAVGIPQWAQERIAQRSTE